MAKRYNHAYDVAFEVISGGAEEATPKQWLKGLNERVARINKMSEKDLREVMDLPYDTAEEE